MSVDATVERLASSDKTEREAAEEALVAAGAEAVEPVLRALCDEESPIDWSTSASLLRRLGDPAFGPLIAAMAAAPTSEVARRCGWALMAVEVSTPAVYLPALRHPHPKVRKSGIYFLCWQRKAAAEPYLPDLIALLDDPDEGVRDNLIRGFGEIGAVAAPALREVRRGAGRKRRGALAALAEIGGWGALDDHDRQAIIRLIEIKSGYEDPEPMHLCGSWYAVPTADQAAVLDAFDLVEPRPVTMRLGESAWNRDSHSWTRGPHHGCRRVYVTPALDGWTLVFGRMPAVAHAIRGDDFEAVFRADAKDRCARLSARFGAAHWYGTSCGDGWTAWCIAEKGEVVRFYDVFGPDDQIGDGHPAEAGYRLPHDNGIPESILRDPDLLSAPDLVDRIRRAREEEGIPEEVDSTEIAGRLSVNPHEFGPHTRVEGRAVLALTACGVAHGSTPGVVAI
ncbi:hypothetical protein FHR83_001782 [Actinoplanes campanulatus]|uniref:HEAT repeat-containing protein n=1 Tax=Actinoplanes campanulatus TaxID=113559 RepID=A0A7W5ADU5_9ACTN|nr:HEAT repeat domain-containing protein [Actinoplanes campanulatus]MBB3094130.1 hypothetical protein [Actinoplanes campanulatus]GGN43494.1 hypothetical protein GCM10010109_75730 [Actinoplanes campanulatus]GID42305.1 hypothetical protein Aca09nite_88110 [Actinoplanes campanulatus]